MKGRKRKIQNKKGKEEYQVDEISASKREGEEKKE
jgi:hypothetical protein